MSSVSLPGWFWIIYYSFLFITLGALIFSLIRKRHIGMSFISIVFVITLPIISLIQGIGRGEGLNEFEHLVSQLQEGAIWSLYVVVGYLFLLVWWFVFLFSSKIIKTKGKNLFK
ncbi:hypothetical protein ABGT22_08345 [Peribacillus frigoritolerans]|uniref:hypothetical protein n=1 Tax=Peribacillus frigoritolerans TaxID=450367 RepID=UPI00345D8144